MIKSNLLYINNNGIIICMPVYFTDIDILHLNNIQTCFETDFIGITNRTVI